MNLLTIDEDLCAKDGLCAMVCPFRLIVLEVGKTFPQPVPGAEQRCIECGHCQAICPHGALTLQGAEQEWLPFDADQLPDFAQLSQLVRGRRSIRAYREKSVDRVLLQRCIELAHFAPTARNSQQIGWLVIDDKDELRRLTELAFDWMRHLVASQDPLADHYGVQGLIRAWEKGYDGILRHAPSLVIMHGPAGYRLAQMDSTICLTTFELVAFSQGIGTCWAGFFQIAARSWPPLQEALHLPEGDELTAAMMWWAIHASNISAYRRAKRPRLAGVDNGTLSPNSNAVVAMLLFGDAWPGAVCPLSGLFTFCFYSVISSFGHRAGTIFVSLFPVA